MQRFLTDRARGRNDSVVDVMKWAKELKFEDVADLQDKCEGALKALGYETFGDAKEIEEYQYRPKS